MSGTLTTRFFAPATATTTAPGGVTTEFVSDSDGTYGIDVSAGYVDVSGSGVNFVPGGDYLRVRRLVDDVTTILGEALEAGAFLVAAGIAVADGVTGAGAGVGLAVAAARSVAVLSGGGIFAAGMGDDADSRTNGWNASAQPRQTPAEVRPESPETVIVGVAATGPAATAAVRPTPEPMLLQVFADMEITRLGGELVLGVRSTLSELVRRLEFGRVARAVTTTVNDWIKENGFGAVPKDWFELHFVGLLEDRAPGAPVVTLQAVAEDAPTGGIVWKELLIDLAANWYFRQINNSKSPIYQVLPTDDQEELGRIVQGLVTRWYDLSIRDRLEWNINRPDVVPVNWFVEEANKARGRALTERPLVPWSGRSIEPMVVAGIVPTYLMEEKEVRKYLMLAQNREGPLADLNLGDDTATVERTIRFMVEMWFAKPLMERETLAPNNPNDMPIEWFKRWILGH